MRTKSRTYNSIVNSLFGIGAAIISVVLNFTVRVFIVRALGEEINGLHNLFQNTINVLALMESGIVSAMIIHLYEPVKDNNVELITQLMRFYKKIYLIIAFAFLIFGIIVDVFFMDRLVTSSINSGLVKLYFLIFSLSFFINYLTYYKRSILFASQQNRISILATTVSEVIFRGLAIASAVITHNYLYFLLFMIAEKLCGNLFCITYVNNNYPYLRKLNGPEVNEDKKKKIYATIKPLLVNQIAGTVQKSANSILISLLLGSIAIVGYYGNYQLVVSAVELLFSQMGGAFTSSFGNLATYNDHNRMYHVYRKTAFLIDFLALIMCAGFIACIQIFIEFVFGASFVLPLSAVIILTVSLYVYLINIPIISIQNAMGLHKLDASIMIVQAIIAVLLGYIGGRFFGMNGILIGLNLPTVVFTMIYKGIIISQKAFGMTAIDYLAGIAIDIIKAVIICLAVYYSTSQIQLSSAVLNFIVHGIIAVGLSVILYSLFSLKNKYFHELVNGLTNRISRRG